MHLMLYVQLLQYLFIFLYVRNVKPDNGCLLQPKHVAFGLPFI